MINVNLSIEDAEALENATGDYGDYRADLCTHNLQGGRAGYEFIRGDYNTSLLGTANIVKPSNIKERYWSTEQSNDNCIFENPPTITFTFDRGCEAKGLTIFYLTPWQKAHKVKITWYFGDEIASQKEYITPYEPYSDDVEGASSAYLYPSDITGTTKLKIEFLESWLPNQCIILRGVTLGYIINFNDEEIIKAKYTEVVNEVCETMEYGTAEIEILDEANIFNPTNVNGSWQDLRKYQTITLKATDGDVNVRTYWYIETFEYKEHVLKFKLVDFIGLADTRAYPGCQYVNATFPTIINNIASQTHLSIGRIAGTQQNAVEYFCLPPCTAREAIQQVCLMFNYDILPHYSAKQMGFIVKDYTVRDEIMISRKFTTDTEFADEVTGITFNVISGIVEDSETTEIINQHMAVGKYRIQFSEPYRVTSVVGATNITSGTKHRYIDISVTTAGNVIISGRRYEYKYTPYSRAIDGSTDVSTYKEFKDIPIYNAQTLEEVLEKTALYYAKRQKVKSEIIYRFNVDTFRTDLLSDAVGKYVLIQSSQDAQQFACCRINKVEVDVTGGFTAKIECRGFSQIVSPRFQMGVDDYTMADSELL